MDVRYNVFYAPAMEIILRMMILPRMYTYAFPTIKVFPLLKMLKLLSFARQKIYCVIVLGRRERDRPDSVLMGSNGPQRPSFVRRPDSRRAVTAGRDDAPPVRAEGRAGDQGIVFERVEHDAALTVPHPRRAVIAGRDDPPVRAEDCAFDRAPVPSKRGEFRAALGVPDPRWAVRAGRDDAPSIRAEDCAFDRAIVP